MYEALLSFRGFLAQADLYEVQTAPKNGRGRNNSNNDDEEADGDGPPQAAGREHDELEVGHFVNAERLKAYRAEEIVPDPATGLPKCYRKGSFLYGTAGELG